MIEALSIILGLLGAISIIAYLISYWFYSPRIEFRVGGEQSGEPIRVISAEQISFAVFTKSSKTTRIIGEWIHFHPDEVDLFKTMGVKKEMGIDRRFPMSISFPEEKNVTKGVLQANYFNYQARSKEFTIKFDVLSEIDPVELPFFLDMFLPRKVRSQRIVTFKVDNDVVVDLKTHGLAFLPGESMQMAGVQSQEGVTAVADEGQVKVFGMVLVDDENETN